MNDQNSIKMENKLHPEDRAALLASQWLIFRGEPTQMLGFQAVLKFLRHVYSYLPREPLKDVSSDELLVLQLAGYVPDEGEEDNVKGLKKRALGEICPDWESSDRAEPASFLELIEGDKLISHLWSRQDFLLYNPRVFSLDPGAAFWAENDAPRSAEEVARHSLIKYDGTRPIQDTVKELFGPFRFQTGYRYMRLPLMPLVLRVLYTPTEAGGVRFHQLQHFVLKALNFEQKDEETGRLELQRVDNDYLLAAIVRLRADPTEPDLIRTYDQDGTYLLPFGEGRAISNDDWRVGQHGHSYMLMYVDKGNGIGHFHEKIDEVIPFSEASERRMDKLRAAHKILDDASDPVSNGVGQVMSVSQGRQQSTVVALRMTDPRPNSPGSNDSQTCIIDGELGLQPFKAKNTAQRESSASSNALLRSHSRLNSPSAVAPMERSKSVSNNLGNKPIPPSDLRADSARASTADSTGSTNAFPPFDSRTGGSGPDVDFSDWGTETLIPFDLGGRNQTPKPKNNDRKKDKHVEDRYTGLHPDRVSKLAQPEPDLGWASKRSPYSLDDYSSSKRRRR
ncbi:hypothetical protein F4821DRAFT_265857 [Hypoxylon rubiginosum]|uniref:Uncharacterized protein n=1 Tax=Hypoxylon rubiginosum TaxID=110542 RepID=A0ACC0CJE5_9PEZI|nr:hypothetical protein F4821DRAFT_265857 [Hypoxylon rubiginosum]